MKKHLAHFPPTPMQGIEGARHHNAGVIYLIIMMRYCSKRLHCPGAAAWAFPSCFFVPPFREGVRGVKTKRFLCGGLEKQVTTSSTVPVVRMKIKQKTIDILGQCCRLGLFNGISEQLDLLVCRIVLGWVAKKYLLRDEFSHPGWHQGRGVLVGKQEVDWRGKCSWLEHLKASEPIIVIICKKKVVLVECDLHNRICIVLIFFSFLNAEGISSKNMKVLLSNQDNERFSTWSCQCIWALH